MKVETISFKTEYAEKYGIECAILIQGIQLGLSINYNKPSHNKFGKVWMYNSVKDWHRTYPFMSESTIKRALVKLKDDKVIEIMKLDSNPMNKTNWYTLNQSMISKWTNALGQNDPIEEVKLNQSKQYKTNNVKQTVYLGDKPQKQKTFIIPSVDEIKTKFPNINAQVFYDFYSSKGWVVGKSPMKDWEAAARNWLSREEKNNKPFESKNVATLNDD
jgi:hypothetical protein